AYDFQSVATHEIGHLYGLDHVSSLYNTMYYLISKGETYKRSPAAGDALGLRAIYG
ncbi:MAG: matrixin family metalloprotease, partial [Acidimicrobiia bacterium]|nr:matrixin family metalloprotease [Acidimicrobiia bacterium]